MKDFSPTPFFRPRPPPTPATKASPRLALWPGAIRRASLPAGSPIHQIELDSHLVYAPHLGQGETVAILHVLGEDGTTRRFPLRAGLETAEWSIDRPWNRPAHAKPPVARSWTVSAEGYEGHTYRATFSLPPGFRPHALILERTPTTGEVVLVIEQIRLDGCALSPPQERFHFIRPGLYENRYALPRAFLVRHARQVPQARLLEELKGLDPEQEVLLTVPLPPEWRHAATPMGPPLPPVKFLEYRPHRIRVETEITEPLVLVLSDTYDPHWHAWDNGRPVQILRADHALRALLLAPGHHIIEFRYAQPSFWVGPAISLGTLLALAGGGLAAWWGSRKADHASAPWQHWGSGHPPLTSSDLNSFAGSHDG